MSISLTRDIDSLNKNLLKNSMNRPPIITAMIKPMKLPADINIKDEKSSPKSLSRAKRVFIELTMIRRTISIIISSGVLTMIILLVSVNKFTTRNG